MNSVPLSEMICYVNQLLRVDEFADYCPNGLQLQAATSVTRVASAVTASMAAIERAAALGADLLLVHHGYFWKGEAAPLVGIKGRRVARLFAESLSMAAYHLPLDAHPEYGNNAQLAIRLDIREAGAVAADGLLWRGVLPRPMAAAEFVEWVTGRLGRAPMVPCARAAPVRHLAWCTGGAPGYFERAIELGVDAYLTGEANEPVTHLARESGLLFMAAGHHATERYGVQALGEHLAERFAIEHRYLELDNPV
jgi:dinuclear metal center YbgI/SA1388 family protein